MQVEARGKIPHDHCDEIARARQMGREDAAIYIESMATACEEANAITASEQNEMKARDYRRLARAIRAIAPIETALPPAPQEAETPFELSGISDALESGKGVWRTCSGCHESNEGYHTGPYSSVMRCHLGGGCFECGGIGAVWDMTDYEHMAHTLAETPIT